MAKTLAHEPEANRYTLTIDGQLVALADYVINGHSISFNHTFTQPAQRGQGYAAEVVNFAMNDVEATSDRVVMPMCWYVAEWFDKHRSGLHFFAASASPSIGARTRAARCLESNDC